MRCFFVQRELLNTLCDQTSLVPKVVLEPVPGQEHLKASASSLSFEQGEGPFTRRASLRPPRQGGGDLRFSPPRWNGRRRCRPVGPTPTTLAPPSPPRTLAAGLSSSGVRWWGFGCPSCPPSGFAAIVGHFGGTLVRLARFAASRTSLSRG